MKCIGRTKSSNRLQRCSKDSSRFFPFCWQHTWQPLAALVAFVGFGAALAGFTGYSLKDIFGKKNEPTEVVSASLPEPFASRLASSMPPDADPLEKRATKVIQDSVQFTDSELEFEVYQVPLESEFVFQSYSVSGEVRVELLWSLGGTSFSAHRYGRSEGGAFFKGKGEVIPGGTRLILRSLVGAGAYSYEFEGYLRPGHEGLKQKERGE